MYLLILIGRASGLYPACRFTFHNVSINSTDPESGIDFENIFTFHNVSINSAQDILDPGGYF